jgi:hypothetical protein
VGLFADFSVMDRLISLREAEQPDPARRQHYAALLELFGQAYAALDPISAQLARLSTAKPDLKED